MPETEKFVDQCSEMLTDTKQQIKLLQKKLSSIITNADDKPSMVEVDELKDKIDINLVAFVD
jgi:hypothetical protein